MMDTNTLIQELRFKTARSGGAGGQHVNKVESKVLLQWDVDLSLCFDAAEKDTIKQALSGRINKEGLLQLESSLSRSQSDNKEDVIRRFLSLLETSLKPRKRRIQTKIPRAEILKRLDRKKKQSQKKQQRRGFDFE